MDNNTVYLLRTALCLKIEQDTNLSNAPMLKGSKVLDKIQREIDQCEALLEQLPLPPHTERDFNADAQEALLSQLLPL